MVPLSALPQRVEDFYDEDELAESRKTTLVAKVKQRRRHRVRSLGSQPFPPRDQRREIESGERISVRVDDDQNLILSMNGFASGQRQRPVLPDRLKHCVDCALLRPIARVRSLPMQSPCTLVETPHVVSVAGSLASCVPCLQNDYDTFGSHAAEAALRDADRDRQDRDDGLDLLPRELLQPVADSVGIRLLNKARAREPLPGVDADALALLLPC